MVVEVHISDLDVELCQRRAVDHARAEEEGDKDRFVHFACVWSEGVSWVAGLASGLRFGLLVGCGAGLTRPSEAPLLCFFYLFSVIYVLFESVLNSLLFLQLFYLFQLDWTKWKCVSNIVGLWSCICVLRHIQINSIWLRIDYFTYIWYYISIIKGTNLFSKRSY